MIVENNNRKGITMGINEQIQRLLHHDAMSRQNAELQERLARVESQLAQARNSTSNTQPRETQDVICLTCGWHAEDLPADRPIPGHSSGGDHVLRITRIGDTRYKY